MPLTLFCMPIKKGKTEDYKTFLNECLRGSKQEDYKDLLLRYEINSLQMWIHTIDNKDHALFLHDMTDNAVNLLGNWTSSPHPFDQWFKTQLEDCYAIENMDKTPPQPVFFGEIDARKH